MKWYTPREVRLYMVMQKVRKYRDLKMNKEHLSKITELQGYITIAYLRDNDLHISDMTDEDLKEYEKHRDKKMREFYEALRFYYE